MGELRLVNPTALQLRVVNDRVGKSKWQDNEWIPVPMDQLEFLVVNRDKS